jgi:acyl-CoA-binding protein
MALQQDFEQAVSNSKSLTAKPDNETLLKLYALYKQSTEGDQTGEAPTNTFDFVGKAKYEAWIALKGFTKEASMQQYIDLINKLR